MIDPNEVTYLCDYKLYNVNGQAAFTRGGGKVDMPSGHPQQDSSGAYELKLAWKIMAPDPKKPCKYKDDLSRFFVQDAKVMDLGPDGKPVEKAVSKSPAGAAIGSFQADRGGGRSVPPFRRDGALLRIPPRLAAVSSPPHLSFRSRQTTRPSV
jgi:hypothetical protein